MSQNRGLIPNELFRATGPLVAIMVLGAGACTGQIVGSEGEAGLVGGSSASPGPGDGSKGGSPPGGGDLPQEPADVAAACAAKAGVVDRAAVSRASVASVFIFISS